MQTELQCRNKYSVCKCLYDFITYKVDKRNNAARHLPLKSPVKNWMYKEIEDEQVTGVRIHCKKPWIVVASSRHRFDYKDNIFYQAKVNKVFEEEVEALFID